MWVFGRMATFFLKLSIRLEQRAWCAANECSRDEARRMNHRKLDLIFDEAWPV